MALHERAESILGKCAHRLIDDLPVLEHDQGGNALDSETCRERLVGIHVDLRHGSAPLPLGGEFLENGSEDPARRAPRCPEIDEKRTLRSANRRVEIVLRQIRDVGTRHEPASGGNIATVRDPRPQPGLPPLRRFGQHFLVDPSAVRRIVDAAGPSPDTPVLEIGPGTGALTAALVDAGARVVAVEIDRGRAASLRERFQDSGVVVLEEDILRFDLASAPTLLGMPTTSPMIVVGNLPYNISKPIALRMVEQRRSVIRAVLMFQREVAERLSAGPGTKAYAPLSVLAGLAFRIDRLFHLGPGAFRPPPAVTSTVTGWARREDPGLSTADEPALRSVLRAAFRRRRASLRRNLRDALGDLDARNLLRSAGIDGGLRAEQIAPEEFLRLAEAWPAEPRT